MKKIILPLLLLFAASAISAQCSSFFEVKQGLHTETEHFDAKGKKTGTSSQTCTKLTSTAGGGFQGTLNTEYKDAKGKVESSGDVVVTCENGSFMMDMSGMMPKDGQKDMKMDIKFEAAFLAYPNNLAVGQSLPDGTMTGSGTMEGGMAVTMKFSYINRKVTAKENVTTPLGTMEAYKIESEIEMVNEVMGMSVPMKFKTAEWVAPKYGTIKTESYNKGGKLQGYTLLSVYKG